MKILLLFILFIFGCKENNLLNEVEEGLYSLDEVYVLVNQEDVHQMFEIRENDYEDFLALKTLVFYEQKEIYVFYKASDSLKNKVNALNKENMVLLEIDSYLYFGVDDSDVIDYIKDILNK